MVKVFRNKDRVSAVQFNGENKNYILTTFPMIYQDESGFLFLMVEGDRKRKPIIPGQWLGRYLDSNKYCIWGEGDFAAHFEEIGQ